MEIDYVVLDIYDWGLATTMTNSNGPSQEQLVSTVLKLYFSKNHVL